MPTKTTKTLSKEVKTTTKLTPLNFDQPNMVRTIHTDTPVLSIVNISDIYPDIYALIY